MMMPINYCSSETLRMHEVNVNYPCQASNKYMSYNPRQVVTVRWRCRIFSGALGAHRVAECDGQFSAASIFSSSWDESSRLVEGSINECVNMLTLTRQATERFILYFYIHFHRLLGHIHKQWVHMQRLGSPKTRRYYVVNTPCSILSFITLLLYLCILLLLTFLSFSSLI